jgi:hypothetical protein
MVESNFNTPKRGSIQELAILAVQGNEAATAELIQALTRIHFGIAKRYNVDSEEFQSFMAVEVIELLKTYNPEDSLFSTYFNYRISNLKIRIVNSHSAVYIPREVRRHYWQAISEIEEGRSSKQRPENPFISALSLDAPVYFENEQSDTTMHDQLPDNSIPNPETAVSNVNLLTAICTIISLNFNTKNENVRYILEFLKTNSCFPSDNDIEKKFKNKPKQLRIYRVLYRKILKLLRTKI